MTETRKQKDQIPGQFDPLQPVDAMAAAAALGIAMTAQAMEMWVSVFSGFARVSQDMIASQAAEKPGEPAPYLAKPRPAAVDAKSATRTVVADIERTVQDVAEVTAALLKGAGEPPMPESPAASSPPQAKPAQVLPFKEKTKKAVARKPARKVEKAAEVAAPVRAEPTVPASVEIAAPPAAVQQPPAVSDESVVAIQQTAAQEPAAAASASSQPPAMTDRPAAPDDLKLIAGVGPKLETILNGLGVWTFAQIAAWRQEEVAWVDDHLGLSGRINRDGWVERADALSKGVKAAS